jgi:hypothetical protein
MLSIKNNKRSGIMKNAIKNFIAASLTATVIIGSSIAAKADDTYNTSTVISTVKHINKIAVSGNVELILIQDVADHVKVYNDYYASNALIQEKDGLLRISSYNRAKLTVVVHVKNLSALDVEDKSTVKTYGNFYLLDLNIALRDQAKADINANTTQLTTTVSGDAELKLAGSTEEYAAKMNDAANVNMEGFIARNSSISSENSIITQASAAEDIKADTLLKLYEMATR